MDKIAGPHFYEDDLFDATGGKKLTPSIYHLLRPPTKPFSINEPLGKWSGVYPIPPIGTHVRVTMNKLGTGVIRSYFLESGWLGVEVTPDVGQRPDWHIKQNGDASPTYLVFGCEIEVIT